MTEPERVLFLDIDGVVHTREWRTLCPSQPAANARTLGSEHHRRADRLRGRAVVGMALDRKERTARDVQTAAAT